MKVILIILIFILVILFFIYNLSFGWGKNRDVIKEKWQNYMDLPFDYLDTGSNPLNFYQKDKYRKPYRWPFKFYQSYPLPSMQAYPLL